MSKITVDAATAEKLKDIEPVTELYGPEGQLLGGVCPPNLLSVVRWAIEERQRWLDEDPVTLEELQAADAAGGEYTMEDVMKLLERKP
jgi:hypothetical protein